MIELEFIILSTLLFFTALQLTTLFRLVCHVNVYVKKGTNNREITSNLIGVAPVFEIALKGLGTYSSLLK